MELHRGVDGVGWVVCQVVIRRTFVQYFIERQGDVDAGRMAGNMAA